MRRTFVLFFALASCFSALEQKVLTDDDIIKMLKGGLSDDVIVLAIESQPSNFDILAEALIELKLQGASKAVLDKKGNPSTVMQVLKQRFARRLLSQLRRASRPRQLSFWDTEAVAAAHVWQRRFYDFNLWSEHKRIEKLRYMHRNPVTRGLVSEPEEWRWSSYRQYAYGEAGPVRINDWPCIELKVKPAA